MVDLTPPPKRHGMTTGEDRFLTCPQYMHM